MNMNIERDTLKKFPWGPVVDVHEIAEYSIVEYRPQIYKNGTGTREYHEYTHFHPYINGKDTCHCYESLDSALIGSVAYKHDGINSQAARYFCKMIGLDDEKAK